MQLTRGHDRKSDKRKLFRKRNIFDGKPSKLKEKQTHKPEEIKVRNVTGGNATTSELSISKNEKIGKCSQHEQKKTDDHSTGRSKQ